MIKKNLSPVDLAFAALSFLVPLFLFYITSSDSLMFDDAGEFALVIKLGSIAHPPGTPAYIFTAMLWQRVAEMFGCNDIVSVTLYSSFCISLGSLLLFFAFRKIMLHIELEKFQSFKSGMISLFSALAFAVGFTTWTYANTIEVYSFQELAMCIAFCGLVHYHFNRSFASMFVAGLGIAFGISNHHLTMILFLPFVPLFFLNNLFISSPLQTQKKKIAVISSSVFKQMKDVIFSKSFWQLAGIAVVFTVFFYGWMYMRAQKEYPFMFGKPDNLGGLIYHLRGASYSNNLTKTSAHLIGVRVPFFLKLTFFQYFLFFPFLVFGFIALYKSRRKLLANMMLLFYLFLLTYQLFNNQWANTDAYMLLPFTILIAGVFFGIQQNYNNWKLQYVLPLVFVAQVVYNFPENNRKTYPVSNNLMHLLDKSAPKNSIIMISDWTTVIQYYYFRITQNFRPDLVVLNYDIKFTHYRILPIMYPEFYKKIKPEYDALIEAMRQEHPDEVTNTGCNLTTPVLMDAFHKVISRMEAIATAENIPFMTDPKAHIFYVQQHFYSDSRYVSGSLISTIPGDSVSSAEFLRMDFPFLSSKLLLNDGGALDKLEDFHALVDYHIMFYTAKQDTYRLEQANAAKDKIYRIQKELRKSMSFAYTLK